MLHKASPFVAIRTMYKYSRTTTPLLLWSFKSVEDLKTDILAHSYVSLHKVALICLLFSTPTPCWSVLVPQAWVIWSPASSLMVPSTSDASVSPASRRCVGTSLSCSRIWPTSPCRGRQTWTLQGRRKDRARSLVPKSRSRCLSKSLRKMDSWYLKS